ncbi:MAG: alpha/beta fold hydrolase [Candidatus Eremiobacteraeota bacterium]|nr:alpha/beta fold hydrolase [Candidatus Eremiobacteraeota bacterium]
MKRTTFLAAAAGAVSAGFAVRPVRASEADIALSTPTGTIMGTLVIPSKMLPPVVLIVAGSGPTDRNGNNSLGIGANAYGLLAEALAQRGVGSLRYDKRGIGKSAMSGLSESDVRFETLADDAAEWIRWLRADGRMSKIVVAGHSEGSLLGMLALQRAKGDAFVSLEGAGRPAPVVLREQIARNAPQYSAESDAVIAQLAAGHTVSDPPPELDALFRTSVQPYLISWFKYDPAVEFAKLRVPSTIVQGTADVQITMDDARALQRTNTSAKLVVVDGMNHVLKYAPDTSTPAAIAKGYEDPALPVDPHAIDAVYEAAA